MAVSHHPCLGSGLLTEVLRGIVAQDLEAVLDFMYQGNVNVDQKELDAFLALAKELKLKGLGNGGSPIESPIKEMNYVLKSEPQNSLKFRKPEDLFKPKDLGNNPNVTYSKYGIILFFNLDMTTSTPVR
mgnify:CR=1 FL=1